MISLNLIILILCGLILVAAIISVGLLISMNSNASRLRSELGQSLSEQSLQNEQKLDNIRSTMETRIGTLQEDNSKQLDRMRNTVDEKLENNRHTMETRLGALQEDNSKQLDKMRQTVDEKLQKTLEERLGQSFKLVSDRLEQVHKGLGEMQNLASGVGDLKKVLSNVKTRGILGEIQLGSILEEILTPEQYEENINTIPGSTNRVEYAIHLPGDGEIPVLLPIDAKFPIEPYSALLDAYDLGAPDVIEKAKKNLDIKIKDEAKTISSKYVEPPHTTDFAIMFLPIEGLYAEVVRGGLVEELQRSYKINVAGPSTMAALLNSLQMGFRTLAIQKRSGEVWNVLSGVKEEFGKFTEALERARSRIGQADEELDKLINTRTNMMNRQLKNVTTLTIEDGDNQ